MGSKRYSCDKASCSMCQVFMFQEIFIPLTVSVLPLGFVSRDIYTLAVVVWSLSEAGLITDFPPCTFPLSQKLTADLSSLMPDVDLHNVDNDGWNKEARVGTYWKIANASSSILQAHAIKRKVVVVVWGGQHKVSAMNNQYLSWNADPQRVNECAARMGNGNCLRLKLCSIKLEEWMRNHLKTGIKNSHNLILGTCHQAVSSWNEFWMLNVVFSNDVLVDIRSSV